MKRHFFMISRALNARKRKIFALFFALAAVVTGAMAQQESLLTTLTFGGSETYGETTSGVVTVTATNVGSYNGTYGWLLDEGSSLSVTAKEGYTITKCVFRQNAKTPITDTEAPFEIHTNYWGGIIEDPEEDMNGVTSIEVYGYANAGGGSAATVTWNSSTLSSIYLHDGQSFTQDGVTLTALDGLIDGEYGNWMGGSRDASFKFSTSLGNFTKIEITGTIYMLGGSGWTPTSPGAVWTGEANETTFGMDFENVSQIVFTIGDAAPVNPKRYTDTVKIEDLVVGDTLAMGAKMNSDQYFLFYCAPNRARRHGNLWTSDFESFFLGSADAISKHGAIDLENPDGLRGCLEPVNENGELAEEWIVTSTNPFTIAGIGKAEITNHCYRSEVDYAALEPGDTIAFGASITNAPEKVWFLANRMQRIFSSGEISIIDDDRWSNSYGTIGKNGVLKADNYGTTQVPINEQGTLGGKWVVVFYSPLTIAGIGYPMPTLTLSDKVSILNMPIAGINDIGNNNYEVEPGTQFQIQAAVPEHYSLVGWSDLASTDPNYTANPRTITINSDSTILPIYAIDTYTLTLGVNDSARGSVKIAPGVKKSVWDKEFLNNMYIWVQMMPSSAPHVEHNNNEKDNIRIEGQPMQTEVMWYYTTYFDPKGSSYIYMYEAGKAQFLFGFINGHHTFQRIEIYSTEGSNQYDGGWEYNTEKGCYQTTATEPFDMASLVLAEGQGVYLPVDSLIFYVPSELPEGVVPTETPGVYTVDYGTELSFVATPASEDYYLAKWNDEPATSDTLKLTMNGELAVNANFAHVPYIYTLPEGVSIVGMPIDGITDKGNGVYEIVEGTEFQISADSIPAHYHFDHWADLADSAAMYAANPRTIVAGENLTVEPIFAIDTYIVTLASNDSTMGTLRVEGAGGSNIGPKEEINIYHGVVGEHYQVLGEYSGSSWIGVGGNDNKTITVESLNGEIIDNITLEVYMPSHWTGYSIAATSGNVSGDVANYQNLVITNINATSVTLSRVGEGENGGSVLFSEITVNGRDEQQGGQAEPITVTWNNSNLPSSGNANSFTLDGVTITCGGIGIDWGWKDFQGNGTFTTDLGNFTKIEVTAEYCEMDGEGWSGVSNKMTWTGNAASVSYNGGIMGCLSIVFTIEPTAAPAAYGIVDNGDGTYTVDWGTEMSIIAEPAEGYMLASWNGEPALSDTLKQTVEGALSINATFKHIPAVITLPEGVSIVGMPIEGITSKGEGVYEVEYGTEFQISADSIPAHYHFDHWADLADSAAMYAANPRTIVAGENLTIEPIFAIDTYTLTLATNDSTMGTLSVAGIGEEGGLQEPSAQLIVPESWSSEVGVTITAADLPGFVASTEEAVKALPVPTEGSVFVIYNFKDDGGVEAVTFENGEYVRTTSTRVDHANASYYSNQGMIFLYTTAAGQAGQGGEGGEGEEQEGIVDNGDGTYTVDWGTELTFVAQPAEGFMLESWSNGAEVTGDTLKLTMTEELSLTANFKYIPAVITLPEGVNIVEPLPAGITALGEGVYEVEHGTEFQISADGAPEHYHFDHWADLDSTNTEYYANPRTVVADTNFTANPFYTIDTYTLTLASNDTTMGKLTIEPADGIVANGDGTYTVDWCTEVTFVAVPAEDYHLLSWSNGAAVSADNKQTLTVTEALSLSAFFKHDTYILTVEGAEVEVAKFYDGTNTAVVTNPGTLIGVQAGDSVKLTTTATFSSDTIGNDLDITLHYAIEVIDGGIYDNEYALAVTDTLFNKKGFIIESMIPDTTAAPEEEEAEVKEGIEVYGYGYCADGNMTGMRYHLKHGNPNQYKVEFEDARFDNVDWTDLDEKGPDGVIYVTVPVDVPTGDYKMTVTFRDHTEYYSLESAPVSITFHVNLPETYVVALFDDVMAVVDTCECLTDIQWYWRADSKDQWQAIPGATGYYYKQAGGLSGEYFIHAKMNGIDTYTCPQEDLSLYADGKRAKVTAYPNPVQSTTTVTIENSLRYEHDMRIVNLMGNEVLNTTFEGNTTTVEMDAFPHGSYIISVDGVVVNVMKK